MRSSHLFWEYLFLCVLCVRSFPWRTGEWAAWLGTVVIDGCDPTAMCLWSQSWVHWRSSSTLNLWVISPASRQNFPYGRNYWGNSFLQLYVGGYTHIHTPSVLYKTAAKKTWGESSIATLQGRLKKTWCKRITIFIEI